MATESDLREKYLAGMSGMMLSDASVKERFIWAFQHNLGIVPLGEFPEELKNDLGPALQKVLGDGDLESAITGMKQEELSDLAYDIVSFYGHLHAGER